VEQTAAPPDVDPRIERTRRVVLDTAIALLGARGYGEVTIEAVAAASGVAKSTIYRHWPSRVELINDAFQELRPALPVPPEGDVRDRLVAVLEHVAKDVCMSRWSACLPALLDAAAHDPTARELNLRLATSGRQLLSQLLADGVSRGELPADLDTELIADALAGPIILRRLWSAETFDPGNVRHLVDQVLGCHTSDAARS
jgi:AcrR family transcriptional regulator